MRIFDPESRPQDDGWRARVYEVIFETDTRAGLLFDILLLVAIMISILAISLESVPSFEEGHRQSLRQLEWVVTAMFTLEYILRLTVVEEPKRYAFSLMGIVDLLSLLPTYLSLLFIDAEALQVIRALRLLRVFRVFQLGHMSDEGIRMVRALVASRYKIAVFLGTLLILVVIQGALLYYVEHIENPAFSSIPISIYWAIVTLTTVGYGDISPATVPGQAIASILMLLGYGIIAVPTGIVTAEVTVAQLNERSDINIEFDVPPNLPADLCESPAPIWVTGASDRGAFLDMPVAERPPKPEPERPPSEPTPEPEAEQPAPPSEDS